MCLAIENTIQFSDEAIFSIFNFAQQVTVLFNADKWHWLIVLTFLVDIIAHQEFFKDLYEDSKSSLTSQSVGSKICKVQGNQSEHEISCFYLGDSSFHKAHERFKVNLVTATINIVTVPVGVVANLLIVTAIFSCLRLRTPSNLLKAFLALSDLFVSVTVQPGYITYRLLENQLRLVPCLWGLCIIWLFSVALECLLWLSVLSAISAS